MQKEYSVHTRDEFILLGIRLAQSFLEQSEENPKPRLIIINGDVESGKALLALAFRAACIGETKIGINLDADNQLRPVKGCVVAFSNLGPSPTSEETVLQEYFDIKTRFPSARFIIFSNVFNLKMQRLDRRIEQDLPSGVDCHLNIKKLSHTDLFFQQFERKVTVTSHHDLGLF